MLTHYLFGNRWMHVIHWYIIIAIQDRAGIENAAVVVDAVAGVDHVVLYCFVVEKIYLNMINYLKDGLFCYDTNII